MQTTILQKTFFGVFEIYNFSKSNRQFKCFLFILAIHFWILEQGIHSFIVHYDRSDGQQCLGLIMLAISLVTVLSSFTFAINGKRLSAFHKSFHVHCIKLNFSTKKISQNCPEGSKYLH